jgi:hypothetical protein
MVGKTVFLREHGGKNLKLHHKMGRVGSDHGGKDKGRGKLIINVCP